MLKTRLEKRGMKVVLTKSSEGKLVTNEDRAEKANAIRADLMVRLHCDASSGSGFTVYAPNQPGTIRNARGPSAAVIRQSQDRAKRFHAAMATALKGKLKDNGLHPDQRTAVGSRHGALIGSIFSKVPVVLIEMVVLTNANDEAFLLSPRGQSLMADALEKGVVAALPPN
jgi:N-acetylmuramoyl-L-alanine amidase